MAETMAEVLVKQGREEGREEGTRQTAVKNILTILTDRFPENDTDTAKRELESIPDTDRLADFLLTAVNASSFESFLQALDG